MPSPFPGMDPYLEQYWYDVHPTLMIYARDQIQSQLPGGLRARVEERVTVDDEDEEQQSYVPDVRISERPGGGSRGGAASTAVATEPLVVQIPSPLTPDRRIIILAGPGEHRLVTAIEVLSASNKDRVTRVGRFRDKQQDLLRRGVNVVEIDLLRGGYYALSAPEEKFRDRDTCRISVVRGHRPEKAEIYRVSLRDRLPNIKIPLRPHDADALLELQPLIDQAYRAGAYEGDVDYSVDPFPPLTGEDAAWTEGLLKEKGLRATK